MFKKILIANRGEIACRIIRTAKRMGIRTIAVYSETDANAMHVRQADEAYYIGLSPGQDSYLQGNKIIQTALQVGADAIHPGYGFLSENAAFAAQCAQHGLCFIGASPESIRLMGEKNTAKTMMQQAGVPVIPGWHGDTQEVKALFEAAESIGYPVLIKAVAGGGGKGMRIVYQPENFISELDAAKREANTSFGDDRVLLEKYLPTPRHVEVQIFGDRHGNLVYLFERDCSVQRRHQKIIEEAPAPGITDSLRARMGETAVNAARAIHYTGAGTIEFLLDGNETFYFMEMNTRLQVEHPITEMITGLDLVEWQLRVAWGEPLPIQNQSDLTWSGHAFEARIYAEDPQKNFLPSIGQLQWLSFPTETTDNSNTKVVRVDSGISQNDTISIYYDPMIAKLIVWGENRELARAHFAEALNKVQVIGVQTNVALLKAIVDHPTFVAGQATTHFMEACQTALLKPAEPLVGSLQAFTALMIWHDQTAVKSTQSEKTSYSPWQENNSWRLNLPAQYSIRFYVDSKEVIANLLLEKGKPVSLQLEEVTYSIQAFQANELTAHADSHTAKKSDLIAYQYSALIQGVWQKAQTVFSSSWVHIFHHNRYDKIALTQDRNDQVAHPKDHRITSPMPGKLTAVFVTPGQPVKKGDRLFMVEAMKMQHTLYAHSDQTVAEVYYQVGDLVEEGVKLLSFADTTHRDNS